MFLQLNKKYATILVTTPFFGTLKKLSLMSREEKYGGVNR